MVVGKGLIGRDVQLIVIQFSYANFSITPPGVKRLEQEGAEEFNKRKSAIRGRQCLEPTEEVDGLPLLDDLKKVGYQLVDAFCKAREKDGQGYAMTRFVFAAPDHVESSPDFLAVKDKCYAGLEQMLQQALWRARGFTNPLFRDSEIVDGKSSVSINFEARRPIVDSAGNYMLEWKKDERGQRIGDGPVPISSDLCLRVENGFLCVQGA